MRCTQVRQPQRQRLLPAFNATAGVHTTSNRTTLNTPGEVAQLNERGTRQQSYHIDTKATSHAHQVKSRSSMSVALPVDTMQ